MTDETHRQRPSFGYDVFLSHNHADKAWVRALADRLAGHNYNGRPLRPWLDEQVLDPGILGRDSELTTALDRSRLLAIVLRPEAVRSEWVRKELDYFLSKRTRDEVIVIRRRPCQMPKSIADLDVVEWPGDAADDEKFGALIARICRESEADPVARDAEMQSSWDEVLVASSNRNKPEEARQGYSRLLEKLLEPDINDPAGEGLALAAFDKVGELLALLNRSDSERMKMVFGEILAYAVHSEFRYSQVSSRLLARESDDVTSPDLSFAVIRAASKLAEIDIRLVDPSAVWNALAKLDRTEPLQVERKVVAMNGGRVVGKLRGSNLGDMLIYVLARNGGVASRLAAIGAITMSKDRSGPEYFLSDLEKLAKSAGAPDAIAASPPERIVSLLDGICGTHREKLGEMLENGLHELKDVYGVVPPVPSDRWSAPSNGPPAEHVHNGPMIGTIRRITTANMEEMALQLGPSDVACLTEPRIVDALLDRCGGFIIATQDQGSPLCRRLSGRNRRFAMVDADRMDSLIEGKTIALDERLTLVL